jgi:hypothetical protein
VPKKQEVGSIFVFCGSELRTFFQYSRSKLKKQRSKEVDVLFKAYLMVPLLSISNLAGQYLET